MRNNTIIAWAVTVLILRFVVGCTGVIDVQTEGKKIHVEFKPQPTPADNSIVVNN